MWGFLTLRPPPHQDFLGQLLECQDGAIPLAPLISDTIFWWKPWA